jgi:hypothetical protein
LPTNPKRSCDDLVGRFRAADDLEQAHDVSRTEEVQADDILRPFGCVSNCVDIKG